MARRLAAILGWLALLTLVAPLFHACWLSFAPDEFLTPPTRDWSLRWYDAFFHSSRWMAALQESLVVGGLAICISLAAGLPLAFALAQLHFPGRSLLMGGVLLPLVVPPVLLGIGLLPAVQALGLWGTSLSLACAHALYGMPLVCWLTRLAVAEVNPDIESAARGLGAGPWRVAYRITLPLVAPAVLAGALLAFVLSLNEFVLSLFLGTSETETLPRLVWPNLRYALSPLVAVASCLTTLATAVGIVVVAGLVRRLR